MNLESAETHILATIRADVVEITVELHGCIDYFERSVQERFTDIKEPNLDKIKEEVATLRIEVCSLTECHISCIPLKIPLHNRLVKSHRLSCLDLFPKRESVLGVETKRVGGEDL